MAATVLALAVTMTGHPADPARARSAAQHADRRDHERPNVVFINTDDQRLDDMRWMPFTHRLIGGHGVTFTEALSPHPLCCPARAEFVTGQYGQNNGVHHNEGTHGGYPALRRPGNTLGHWLHDRGYQTAMVGKYLNRYRPDAASRRGWDHWNPSIAGVYSYRRTTFFDDGHRVRRTQHVDDVVTGYASRYIREFSRHRAPFYVWASDLAPHVRTTAHGYGNPLPADRHRGTLAHETNPATAKASYGAPIVNGMRPRMTTRSQLGATMDKKFESRIESLQAVDEGVRRIVATLRRTGELDDTYIFFTTDNGYLLGEHGLTAKNYIFEEALRVPLLVRLPRAARPTTSSVPVTSADIAPTVAALAGVAPGRRVDGTSFARLLTGGDVPWRDTQLVQTGRVSHTRSDQGWLVRGVRTDRWTYGRNVRNGSVQLYDRRTDPLETVNLATSPGYGPVLAELEARTAALKDCAGASCRRSFGPIPEPDTEPDTEPEPGPEPGPDAGPDQE
ncbi:MAG TPA: sulfatase-like hydrolase/transferase [Marmoricola sp.]|nr:sulfatase-like hydrolase/transferase [Marmoricola sp.]